jgi:hypothetical protein
VNGREEVHGVMGLVDNVDEGDDPFEDGSNVTPAGGTAERSEGWEGVSSVSLRSFREWPYQLQEQSR